MGKDSRIDDADALLAFESEAGPSPQQVVRPAPTRRPDPPPLRTRRRDITLWSLAIVAAAATTSVITSRPLATPSVQVPAAARPGRVTLDTFPPGAEVLIDGQVRGLTPLALTLPRGRHQAVLRRGAEQQIVPLDVTPGSEVAHRIEFAATATPTLTTLAVTTEPSGARVTVDGVSRGLSPVTLSDLAAGRHRVVVTSAGVSVGRTVITEAGETTSVVFSLDGAVANTAGWLVIAAPFEVTVVEGNEFIGTSAASRIMVPTGTHQFEFVNAALGYQSRRRVTIEAGRTTVVRLDVTAPVSANASPWAEVVVDGNPVGVTPISNLLLPLGSHQLIFRHPELGERRETVVVTLRGPNRIVVDLTK